MLVAHLLRVFSETILTAVAVKTSSPRTKVFGLVFEPSKRALMEEAGVEVCLSIDEIKMVRFSPVLSLLAAVERRSLSRCRRCSLRIACALGSALYSLTFFIAITGQMGLIARGRKNTVSHRPRRLHTITGILNLACNAAFGSEHQFYMDPLPECLVGYLFSEAALVPEALSRLPN